MKNSLKVVLTLIFLCSSVYGFSQDYKTDFSLLNQYEKVLKLNKKQKRKFNEILSKNESQFANSTLTNKAYNVLLKKEHLDISGILTQEQFNQFKKNRLSIEPHKKYRFK